MIEYTCNILASADIDFKISADYTNEICMCQLQNELIVIEGVVICTSTHSLTVLSKVLLVTNSY